MTRHALALVLPAALAFAGLAPAIAHADPAAAKAAKATAGTPAARPPMRVYKTPGCGCCSSWADHMRRHGFAVSVVETPELDAVRKRLGVPVGKGSCHTAEVAGRTVEGHVPAEDVVRLVALRDGTRGLALPGMPLGSPGMEVPGRTGPVYTVEAFDAKGRSRPFAKHGGPAPTR